jgi:hypothetical protein
MYGRIDAIYDVNPYTIPPRQFSDDPFFLRTSEKDAVSVDGPVWQVVVRTIASELGTDATPTAFAITYKVFGLAVLLVCATLIWSILGRLAPEFQARGTWFFTANPLSLLVLAGAGHNDGIMMLFVLLAVLAQIRGRTIIAVVFLGLAILTKWTIALVLPAYLVWAFSARALRWRTTRQVLIGSIMVVAIAAGLYGEDWAGSENITAVTGNLQTSVLTNSLSQWFALVPKTAGDGLREPASAAGVAQTLAWLITPWVPVGLSLAFLAWAVALLPYARGIRGLLSVWGWTLFAFVCLAGTWVLPWYVVWLLPLAALAPFTRLERATLILSTTVHLITVARVARLSIQFNHLIDYALLLTLLPPLAYVVLSYGRGYKRRVGAAPPPLSAGLQR